MLESGSLETQILGSSREAGAVRQVVRRAAAGDEGVLLLGEPGTGKQLIAQLIHERSARVEAPFLMIDCSLYYERELKRELFGYGDESSAAGGARKGILEFATKGTCYLSHVEELSPAIQDTVLDFLKGRRFCRLGDNLEVESGARLIVSSDKNLEGFVQAGLFSQALFDFLAEGACRLAPLRERKEDIPAIVEALRKTFSDSQQRGARTVFTSDTVEALQAYPWPLNFDELRKEVTRLLERGTACVKPENLSMEISGFWLGQSGDADVRRVVEELDGYIREFRIMTRLHCDFGELAGVLAFDAESNLRNCYWGMMEEL